MTKRRVIVEKTKKIPKYKNPASSKNGLLGGRPKTFTDDIIEDLADKLWEWAKKPSSRYLEEFCAENETYPQRLADFSDKNDRFRESLKFAKSCLAMHIAKMTEEGNNPTAWGIFAMKNIAKWSDRQEIEHSGQIDNAIQIYLPKKHDL